jgi:hypothetical protein
MNPYSEYDRLTREASGIASAAPVAVEPITTVEQLDALPEKAVVLDRDGYAWQWRVDVAGDPPVWLMAGCEGGTAEPEDGPWTLLVPASAPAAPVRLTDPDDPRIRPGAEVLVTRPYTLVGGQAGFTPNEYSVDGFRSWMRKPGRAEFVLVAEAADPDADLVAALDAIGALKSDAAGGRDWPRTLGYLRAAGYDITRVA